MSILINDPSHTSTTHPHQHDDHESTRAYIRKSYINPYHDRLAEFKEFVHRDFEAEHFKGLWNEKIFQRTAPLHIEIGTGNGQFMLDFCTAFPLVNFVGIDFRFKRSYYVAKKLSELPLKNFQFLRAQGERLHFLFNENEIDTLYYFFPDPWPKARHHKKRLMQPHFVDTLYSTIKPGGEIYIKSDHDQYFQWMLDLWEGYGADKFAITLKSYDLREEFPQHFLCSFQTQFEKIFIKQGIKIKALVLKSLKCHTT